VSNTSRTEGQGRKGRPGSKREREGWSGSSVRITTKNIFRARSRRTSAVWRMSQRSSGCASPGQTFRLHSLSRNQDSQNPNVPKAGVSPSHSRPTEKRVERDRQTFYRGTRQPRRLRIKTVEGENESRLSSLPFVPSGLFAASLVTYSSHSKEEECLLLSHCFYLLPDFDSEILRTTWSLLSLVLPLFPARISFLLYM